MRAKAAEEMKNLAPEGQEATQPIAALFPAARCRNCDAAAPGAYCPNCGQETRIALPTARQFLKDAAGRYVAVDGRLWRTLAALLLRPGFLTREYLEGRRRRYVRPARLFLVLSIAMFALFRIVIEVGVVPDADLIRFDADDPANRSARDGSRASETAEKPPTNASSSPLAFDADGNVVIGGTSSIVTDILRPRVERFNALSREHKVEQLTLGAMRYGPYAMVALLPVFALLLKLLYLGRARRYPLRPRRYSEHLVFAAHDLSFLFAIIIIAVLVPWTPLRFALAAWTAVYGLWAMKSVYGGRWSGVFARAAVLGVCYFVLAGFIIVGLLVTAVLVR